VVAPNVHKVVDNVQNVAKIMTPRLKLPKLHPKKSQMALTGCAVGY